MARDLANDRFMVGPVEGWHRFVPLILFVLVFVTTDYTNIDGELLSWMIAG